MKKITKLLLAIFLLTITLQSCSTDSEETTMNASELEKELALENNGILTVADATYIFKKTGETAKFINEDRDFTFKFVNQLSYKTSAANKHAIEGLKITNPDTEEYMVFSNFEELKNGLVQFDAELSTGEVLSSLTYKPGKSNGSLNKWHDEPVIGDTTPVIGAMIEFSQEGQLRNCRAALEVCENTNGVPTVALTNGKGWFTSIESCALECHD
ncbi:hypothetical protein [Salegentibacter salegens]|uniref:Lipoprotein n=1 Tax=Salegentibacter salegens TaxID=143223 RepID=A0A1M7NTN0_9FLAO|nr:hypothetical protein [Salegentibacter salegens]PRX45808.1 hypothetical protein LY58_01807 [Salegentibacter salegens]SHN07389.1 hypothetical protein SAMN05878281_3445 [Salegentibacter salegens]